MAGLSKPAIVVTLPDGKQLDGTAWETSPLAIAEGISSGLAKATCVASVKYSKRLRDSVRRSSTPTAKTAPREARRPKKRGGNCGM